MRNKEKENYLERIPVVNEKISMVHDESGLVTVGIENTGIVNRTFQKLLKKPKVRFIHLDETGSRVISLVDGERNIIAIGENLNFSTESHYICLVRFLRMLECRGVVNFRKR